MKRAVAAILIVLLSAACAYASEDPPKAPKVRPDAPWSWTGVYLGGHIGGMAGITNFSDPYGTSIYADNLHQPAVLGGFQLGFNWQVPGTPWVFGIEGDISLMNSVGTNTCLAYSGYYLSANCRDKPSATTSVTHAGLVAAG